MVQDNQERYEEKVFTELLPRIFYRNGHMSHRNMMAKGARLLVKSLERCYQELGMVSPFKEEDFKFALYTVEHIKILCIVINPCKVTKTKKIILRYGKEHDFMDYKRYLFVMAQGCDLLFCGTPRENSTFSEPETGSNSYYLYDTMGKIDDEEDEVEDFYFEAYLDEDEEMCVLGDYCRCESGIW